MAFVESQGNPGVTAEIDALFKALRTSIRPVDHTFQGKVLGHYSEFVQTVAIAPAANAVLGLLRWPDPTNFCVPLRIYTCVTVATVVTAQRTDPLVLVPTRGYTIAETTNLTAVVLSANNQKLRTNMGSSLAQIGMASAAAGMSGGTKTNDVNAMGAAAFGAGPALAALGTGLAITDLYKLDVTARHPLVLANNEGFLLNWGPTALATGTVTVGLGIDWAEVFAY